MASLNDNLGELNTTTAVLATAMKGVAAAISGLKKGIDFLDKTQKESIKIGIGAKEAQDRLGNNINLLNGTIDRKLTTSISLLAAGVDTNSYNTLNLVNEQQILGQNFRKTAGVFGKLEAAAGLNTIQLDSLSKSVTDNKDQYKVSTEVLIDSIDSLSNNVTQLSIRGIEAPVIDAVQTLTAELGPNFKEPITRVANLIFGAKLEDIGKLAALGLPGMYEIVDTLRNGGTVDALELLKTSAMQIAKTGKSLGTGATSLAAATNVFGNVIFDAEQINKALLDNTKKQKEGIEDQKETDRLFGEAIKRIFDPFKKLIIEAEPAFSKLAQSINSVFDTLYGSEGFEGLIKSMGDSLSSLATNMQNMAFGILEYLNKGNLIGPDIKFGGDLGVMLEARRLFRDLKNPSSAVRGYAAAGPTGNPVEDVKSGTMNAIEQLAKEQGKTVEELRKMSEGFDFKTLNEQIKIGMETGSKPDKETSENTGKMAEVMTNSQSEFLTATNDIFVRTVGAILGYGPSTENYDEQMVGLLGEMVEQTRTPITTGVGEN
jgi:hypothetical protein